MSARDSLVAVGSSLIDRGVSDLVAREQERADGVARNVAEGQRDVLRSFVFRFYHDTMLDTHLSGARHRLGPDSPTPDIRPARQPHSLGGGYHGVDWLFEYDGIKWMARYSYGYESWGLDFYVYGRQKVGGRHWYGVAWTWIRRQLRLREWQIVHSPAWVVEALS